AASSATPRAAPRKNTVQPRRAAASSSASVSSMPGTRSGTGRRSSRDAQTTPMPSGSTRVARRNTSANSELRRASIIISGLAVTTWAPPGGCAERGCAVAVAVPADGPAVPCASVSRACTIKSSMRRRASANVTASISTPRMETRCGDWSVFIESPAPPTYLSIAQGEPVPARETRPAQGPDGRQPGPGGQFGHGMVQSFHLIRAVPPRTLQHRSQSVRRGRLGADEARLPREAELVHVRGHFGIVGQGDKRRPGTRSENEAVEPHGDAQIEPGKPVYPLHRAGRWGAHPSGRPAFAHRRPVRRPKQVLRLYDP